LGITDEGKAEDQAEAEVRAIESWKLPVLPKIPDQCQEVLAVDGSQMVPTA